MTRLILTAGLVAVALFVAACTPAQAAPTGATAQMALAEHEAMAASYGVPASWSQTIGSNAPQRIGTVAAVVLDGGVVNDASVVLDGGGAFSENYAEVRCQNTSAVPVYFGQQRAMLDDRRRYPLCTDTAVCRDSVLTWPTRSLYAVTAVDDAGDPEIECTSVR